MKDIPVRNWIPLTLVAGFFLVILRSPLPEGQLGWHIFAALTAFVTSLRFGCEPGAVKLLSAMALWLGFNESLAMFALTTSFTGVASYYLFKLFVGADEDRLPVLPFAALAFALTIPGAPIWPHAVAKHPAAERSETAGGGQRPGIQPGARHILPATLKPRS